MKEKVKELSAAGFTAFWLPPACKAANGDSMGYDPYDFYDLGNIDQKGSVKTWFVRMMANYIKQKSVLIREIGERIFLTDFTDLH